MPTNNKIIYQCSKCPKTYKSNTTLQKHMVKCSVNSKIAPPPTPMPSNQPLTDSNDGPNVNENIYDINMKFVAGNKVNIEVHKQDDDDNDEEEEEDGKEVLKDILRPNVSHTYQDEIDKLDKLIVVFKTLHVSDDPTKKDNTIEQLKTTITILMTQSQNLIKEMQLMSRKNSYYRNNIMLATFILDKCRKEEPPETDEEFDSMFN